MPDLPPDDPAFLNAYAKAAGVRPRRPSREGSIASGVELYQASDQFRALAQGTRDARRRMLDDVAERYGNASRRDLESKHITKDLSGFSAHARNNRLKMWRGFCKWMVEHDDLPHDPSDGLKKSPITKSDGHVPWSHDEIEAFRTYWPLGSVERLEEVKRYIRDFSKREALSRAKEEQKVPRRGEKQCIIKVLERYW